MVTLATFLTYLKQIQNLRLRNEIQYGNALSADSRKSIKKVMAVDHTHNLSKPNFISPIMYSQYKLMISWLN